MDAEGDSVFIKPEVVILRRGACFGVIFKSALNECAQSTNARLCSGLCTRASNVCCNRRRRLSPGDRAAAEHEAQRDGGDGGGERVPHRRPRRLHRQRHPPQDERRVQVPSRLLQVLTAWSSSTESTSIGTDCRSLASTDAYKMPLAGQYSLSTRCGYEMHVELRTGIPRNLHVVLLLPNHRTLL